MKKNGTLSKQFFFAAILLTGLLGSHYSYGQSKTDDADDNDQPTQTPKPEPVKYPKVVGYLSFIIPVVTMDKNTTTTNFTTATSIGFPVGVNIFYSDRFGFSYEFTPTIKSQNSTSKTSNLLFDPGPMFRFDHGFTFIPRLAFETSGRYGVTPVFNQIIKRTKFVNYFVAASLPVRFGNQEAASIGGNIQFGFIFN